MVVEVSIYFRIYMYIVLRNSQKMTMEFNDEKWYVPLERFPNQLYDNKDETIFRCRKKVLDGVSLFMHRPRNY